MKNLLKKILFSLTNQNSIENAFKTYIKFLGLIKRINVCTDENKIKFKKNKTTIIIDYKHLIYSAEIINMFDYYQKTICPDNNIIDFSELKIHKYQQSGLEFYFSSLSEGEEAYDEYIRHLSPQKGDIVFDCGAFCGVTAYYFSKAVGATGKVYAFEPDDANYDALVKNIELHNLNNVIPIKKGIWSKTTTLAFNNEGTLGGAVEDITKRPFNINKKEIDVISIVDAIKEFNLDKIDFIKMDIEGAEIEALQGAKDFIAQNSIKFSIASYHIVNGERTYKTLEKIFSKINYEYNTKNIIDSYKKDNYITTASPKTKKEA